MVMTLKAKIPHISLFLLLTNMARKVKGIRVFSIDFSTAWLEQLGLKPILTD